MENIPLDQELHKQIFGSVLDRTEMTPFLLLPARDYDSALKQVTKMMVNRGFDALGGDELTMSERERGLRYIRRAYVTIFDGFFPFVTKQLIELAALSSSNDGLYRDCLNALTMARTVLRDPAFRRVVDEDPRHLFCLPPPGNIPTFFRGIGDPPRRSRSLATGRVPPPEDGAFDKVRGRGQPGHQRLRPARILPGTAGAESRSGSLRLRLG